MLINWDTTFRNPALFTLLNTGKIVHSVRDWGCTQLLNNNKEGSRNAWCGSSNARRLVTSNLNNVKPDEIVNKRTTMCEQLSEKIHQ